jgi:Uma2 family endonuclease
MVSQPSFLQAGIVYPESDGNPMAGNTKQFRWIVVVEQNLEWLFADDPNVFVAGDLLWYPVEGNPKIATAPNAMVVFGRPKGDRGSYLQWREGNLPPQVVFEILAPGNTRWEMAKKLEFYDRYGVEEYYIYHPDDNELTGYLRNAGRLQPIADLADWISPRLGIRFDLSGDELQIFRPDGKPFLSFAEIYQQLEQERLRADQERLRADQERLRADQERQSRLAAIARLSDMGLSQTRFQKRSTCRSRKSRIG